MSQSRHTVTVPGNGRGHAGRVSPPAGSRQSTARLPRRYTVVTPSCASGDGAWHRDVVALDDALLAPRAGTPSDVTLPAHRSHGAWHRDVATPDTSTAGGDAT